MAHITRPYINAVNTFSPFQIKEVNRVAQNESKTGINAKAMIDHNRSLVLRHLIKHGVASRADIAKETGLTAASISKITSSLLQQEVLMETEAFAGGKGRKAIGLALNHHRFKVVGVHFNRRSFSLGVFDLGGNCFDDHTEFISPTQGGLQCLRIIRSIIERCIEKYPEIAAIGMAVPGPYLKREGHISVMTNAPEWQMVDFETEFQSIMGRPVFFEHDANAAALAEWYYNTDCTDKSTLAFFYADDGVGAGVVHNGTIFDGHKGYAGEIGHISVDVNGPQCQCGNHGCLEMYCSAIEFIKQAKASLAHHPESSLYALCHMREFDELDVFSAAESGDAYACELVERLGFYLGCGIINLIYAYSPSVIVLGGRSASGGGIMMKSILRTVHERVNAEITSGMEFLFSKLRTNTILTGAATVATNQLLMNLSSYIDDVAEDA